LRIAVIADLHACEPWMTANRIAGIVRDTNALNADLIVLLGDYVAGHEKVTRYMADEEWAEALSSLRAPCGVYAILGNHDWWADKQARSRGRGPIAARRVLERVGIPVLENDSVLLQKEGTSFWIAGLGDQLAFRADDDRRPGAPFGADDLPRTLAHITTTDPLILLAHEPDIFPEVPDRVALTLAGHTHGGQINLFGVSPFVPSRFGTRYIYGHIEENGRHMIVSGGLGCSGWPIRIGCPPEIVAVTIGPQN
jgi:predicted MPP superfamily phosphohydrolase